MSDGSNEHCFQDFQGRGSLMFIFLHLCQNYNLTSFSDTELQEISTSLTHMTFTISFTKGLSNIVSIGKMLNVTHMWMLLHHYIGGNAPMSMLRRTRGWGM